MPRKISKLKHTADLIQAEVSWFNGWVVSDIAMRKSCEKAARKIIRYLKLRDSNAR